ncbi:MAG: L,D-transpeptidase family protein [Azospirillum sp.]|nr:L,D-transpeptidase family protein [Azospirillum sp.]
MTKPLVPLRSGLIAALAVAAAMLAPLSSARADGVGASLSTWVERLDQEAARLVALPDQSVTPIGAGATIRPGDSGERVTRLTARLIELGLLPAEGRSDVYGAALVKAVRGFQAARGLKTDGLVGENTRFALEQTPQQAALLIKQTAQQMRGFQATAPSTYLIVNLPSQTVTLVRDDRVDFTMRAAVGRPSRETPLLSDVITHVIVNPTWTVPPTVLKQDKLPNLRRTGTPGITAASVYVDGAEVVPEAVDWQSVSPGRVRIVQSPGDHNALGRFRFNLTNDQNIYLHDTNEPRVFDRDLRAVSSGCVRLQEARRLAELLLGEVGVGPAKIDRLLATGQTHWIKVAQPLPVRFVYWVATVDADGAVRLHPDIYGREEEATPSSGA